MKKVGNPNPLYEALGPKARGHAEVQSILANEFPPQVYLTNDGHRAAAAAHGLPLRSAPGAQSIL